MSRYLDMISGQHGRRAAWRFPTTSRGMLGLLGFIGVAASGVWWWNIQSILTSNRLMAGVYTALLALGPPVLASFLIPFSPGGMLLLKVRVKTFGTAMSSVAGAYLCYYSYMMQMSWWADQPVTRDANLVGLQVGVGLIGFIVIPALTITAATSVELVEEIKQAHLVQRYELQQQHQIGLLRKVMLRAQALAELGFENLSDQERGELVDVQDYIVNGLEGTLGEIGESVKVVTGQRFRPFSLFGADPDESDTAYALRTIRRGLLGAGTSPERELANRIDGQRRLLQRHREE